MDNEFAALLDLAQKQGLSYSSLLSAVRTAVEQSYRTQYPDASPLVTILIDDHTGDVHLLSGKVDVTPAEFAPKAAHIARMTVLQQIQTNKEHPGGSPSLSARLSVGSLISWIPRLMFWGYNGLYVFGLAMFFMGMLSDASLRHSIGEAIQTLGWAKTIIVAAAAAAPLIAMISAVRARTAGNGSKLTSLLFLFELPVILGSILIVSTIVAPTKFFWEISLVTVMSLITLLAALFPYQPKNLRWHIGLFVCQIWTFQAIVYVFILVSFFLPMVAASIFRDLFGGLFFSSGDIWYEVFHTQSISTLIFLPIWLGIMLLWSGVYLSFLLLPFIMVGVAGTSFWKARHAIAQRIGSGLTNRLTGAAIACLLFISLLLSYQPSVTPYLTKLLTIETAPTFEERELVARELAPHEQQIRRALVNMYDSGQQYLWKDDDTFLSRGYEQVFNLTEATGQFIQTSFNLIAFPFVYRGPSDTGEAARHFASFFGHPITEATIPTPTPQVHVKEQTIQATSDSTGLAATVTIEEAYENQTYRSQEIVYEFSLPNDAVVTELRLGPNLEYPGILAPKGAAQQTYQREVNRSRDPALLEQTGPRQYRLRVFPVPAVNDTTTIRGQLQRMSFSYITMRRDDGIPLPRFSKRQNALIDEKTTRTAAVNGRPLLQELDAIVLEDSLQTRNQLCVQPAPLVWQTIDTPDTYSAVFHPYTPDEAGSLSLCAPDTGKTVLPSLSNARLAVLFDVSAGNKTNPFPEHFRQLLMDNPSFLNTNRIDWYRFNDHLSQPLALTQDSIHQVFDVVSFGSSDPAAALAALPDHYDGVIIVTSDQQPSGSQLPTRTNQTPLYFVHLDGNIPAYPNSWTPAIIRSGGGVVDSLEEALAHLAAIRSHQQFPDSPDQITLFLPGGRQRIIVMKFPSGFPGVAEATFTVPTNPLSFLISKAYFSVQWAQLSRFSETNLGNRDSFYQFSVRNRLISPYTSLIALVNQGQYQTLQQEAQNYDRYDDTSSTNNTNQFGTLSPPISGWSPASGGLSSGWLGMDISNLELPDPSAPQQSDGLKLGIPRSSPQRITSLGSSSGFLWIFIIGNIVLLGIGVVVFVGVTAIRWLRRRKK